MSFYAFKTQPPSPRTVFNNPTPETARPESAATVIVVRYPAAPDTPPAEKTEKC